MKNWAKASILLLMIIPFMLWCIDISVTGMLNSLVLTNGFYNITPNQAYHFAMWVITACVFLIVIFIIKGEEK